MVGDAHTGAEMRMDGRRCAYGGGDAHGWSEMRMDGRRCGPRTPKLEVSARAFLAGALLSAQQWTPGPKVGVLGRGRSSQGRFFSVKKRVPCPKAGVLGLGRSSQGRFLPSKIGPRAQKLVC